MGSLISVNVGLPCDVPWQGKVVRTAIWKRPVAGRVMARRLNLDGDGQGDLAGHGGEQRAAMVYQLDSYRHWEAHLQRHDLEYGQFGENLTVDGLADSEVCIGDRYRIGTALFEVTQPRVTCYRVGIRMNDPQMPALLVSHRRPGFYCRVIEEGEVGAGDEIVKVAAGPEGITVAEMDALLYLPGHPRNLLERALRIPALSDGWKGSFNALLAGSERAGNVGLAASEPPPAWKGFRSLRVAEIQHESDRVLSFLLEAEDRSPLPLPLPGQFLVFNIQAVGQATPIVRSYSISGLLRDGTYRISVKRASGAGTQFFHEVLKAGDLLQVSAPRGRFTLTDSERPIVFLSAGIGVTPVLCMLHELVKGNRSQEIWWCHGTRNGREHAFAKEVGDALTLLPNGHSHIVYSAPDAGDRLGVDYDASGHLQLSALQQLGISKMSHFYLCGPSKFLADMAEAFKAWDLPAAQIHSEAFGSGSSMTPGISATAAIPPHPPTGPAGEGPAVSFIRSGLTVPWSPRFQSILELAEACDVPVRWSCRVGVCHTCQTATIGGPVKYQPEPLERPGETDVLICCATPGSRIELDL